MSGPGWSAVIVNYNGALYLHACITALQATRPAPTEIIVVDNASSDDSLQELVTFPRVHVLAQPTNLGFGGGANVGMAAVETELAVVFNPDVEVAPDFGAGLLQAFAEHPQLGAAGAVLTYPDSDLLQHAGGEIIRPLMTTAHLHYQERLADAELRQVDVDFVTGAALGLRVEAFNAVGGFDLAFSPVYYEDVDLCQRLQAAGWGVQIIPGLRATHHEGVTLERSPAYFAHLHRNRIRFALRHLTTDEWQAEFVPAEFERLAFAIKTAESPNWPSESGATAIEAMLRGDESGTNLVWPELVESRTQIQQLREQLERSTGGSGAKAFRNLVNLFTGNALKHQQDFNYALLATLERQDLVNRQQLAQTLLVMLEVIGRLGSTPTRTDVD